MKRSVSIIAAAAMAASLTLAGAMTSFAAEDASAEQTTSAAETAEPALQISAIAGKWKYQVADGNTSVDKAAKDNGTVEVTSDGKFSYTDASGNTVSGNVVISSDEIAGDSIPVVDFKVGEEVSFSGYYRESSDTIAIGNGGLAWLIRDNGQATETTTTAAAPETTTAVAESTTTTASSAATTTTSAGTTTTKSAGTTTTKAGSKSGNPKTGVAFPAVAASGLAVAAVSVAFALRKKED